MQLKPGNSDVGEARPTTQEIEEQLGSTPELNPYLRTMSPTVQRHSGMDLVEMSKQVLDTKSLAEP